MKFIPENLKRWSPPKCYAGAQWPDYFGAGFGQSRDSSELEASNFATVLAALAKLPAWEGETESRFTISENHWAVGWVEWIAIHESDEAALRLCDGLRARADDYPVLDEDDFSNREMESANQTWANCYDQSERIAYIRRHRSQFEFRGLRDAIQCVRGDFFSGYASELLN